MTDAGMEGPGAPTGVDLGIASVGPAHEIGRGAAGVVYKAEQPAFNRTVAVKLLPFAALDEAARARFERECRAMGSVSGHPGIVTVYEAGFTPSGQPYILMELMDGGSLEQRLAMRGPFAWEEVVEIGVRLAGALEVAHRKGILHRDIKPDNVLVSTYGDAKLADFSIARLAGATKTATGLVAATPAHAPPEVLRGEEPSVRGDVYSLASTLWALLAGGPAFLRPEETTIFPLLRRVEEDPVPDLRPRGIPDPICRVLEQGMAKDPMQRPPSANAFGAELLAARDQARAWHAAGAPPNLAMPLGAAGLGPGGPPTPPPAYAAMASPPPGGHLGMASPTPGYAAMQSPQPGVPFPAGAMSSPAPAQGMPPYLPGSMASPAPGMGWPATAPPAPGSSRRMLIIIGGVLAAAAILAVVLVLTVGHGSPGTAQQSPTPSTAPTATGSGTSTDTSTGSSTDTGSAGGLDGKLLAASDVGSDYSEDSQAVNKFSDLKPCNQDIPLGAKTDESDIGFSNGAPVFVSDAVATFQSGQAHQYLSDVVSASGCGSFQESSSGVTLRDTIAERSGPQLGDETVRLELTGKSDTLTLGEEIVIVRKGDTVAIVSLISPGSPDASTADQAAEKQAGKL